MNEPRITPPLDEGVVRSLRAGDRVLITGTLYTARDAAHKRFMECIAKGESLPVNLKGQILYYTGPTPAPPGKTMGSAGPTTSGRLDAYTPLLIEETGLKGMIGKGDRRGEVVDSIVKNSCVYFAAIGGAGAAASIAKGWRGLSIINDSSPQQPYAFCTFLPFCDVRHRQNYFHELLLWPLPSLSIFKGNRQP